MKSICLAAALALATLPAAAQTMDAAVVESDAASAAGGAIVPLLGLLLLLVVISGPSNTALPPG